MELFGSITALVGSLFFLLGVLGIIRMPDTYNRIQTGTKATSLGTILFLAGIAFLEPTWTAKIVLLILFIFYTNPISSHALARAALKAKVPLCDSTVVNAYEEDMNKNEGEKC